MLIQRIWATIIGTASTVIGILKFFSIVHLPALDATVHIITGFFFLTAAWLWQGRFVSKTNLLLGFFYLGFGLAGYNAPHAIEGVVSILISFAGW